jgi:hypothetical protein
MNNNKRRIVAFIIGKLASGREIYKIFDRSTSSYNEIKGEVSIARINVYDTERNELFTGSGDAKSISIYDLTSAKFIELRLNGLNFDGFDYDSKKIFYGEIKDSTVALFDYQDSKHHYFVMLEEGKEVENNLGLLI